MAESLCPACGRDVPAATGKRPRKWCSESCRVWASRHPGEWRELDWLPNGRARREPQACPRCGDAFTSYGVKYCSRKCATAQRSEHYAALRPTVCREPGCSNPPKGRHPWCSPCQRKRWPGDPGKTKARQRRKTHIRKARTRYTDLSPSAERLMREKAKRCPLCAVRMTPEPYLPTSKELDHIVPLNVGGTHTIGNVRIICRTCNLRRPKDGSDYIGPVTLFALEVA